MTKQKAKPTTYVFNVSLAYNETSKTYTLGYITYTGYGYSKIQFKDLTQEQLARQIREAINEKRNRVRQSSIPNRPFTVQIIRWTDKRR